MYRNALTTPLQSHWSGLLRFLPRVGVSRLVVVLLVFLLSLPGWTWAGEQTVRLEIKGMTCPLCVSAINKALRTTPGVLGAKTNLQEEQASVHVPAGFDVQLLLVAVQEAGFNATVMASEQAAPTLSSTPEHHEAATTKQAHDASLSAAPH